MKTLIHSLAIGACLAFALPAAAASTCPTITTIREMNILFPAYKYPGTEPPYSTFWDRVVQDATIAKAVGFKLIVIVNPNNGDFTAIDPNYAAVVDRLEAAGAMIVGYVYSSNGSRPIADIKANIAAYKTFYPKVDGIFIDETRTDSAHFGYYRALRRAAIQAFGGTAFVIGNAPGDRLASDRFREVFDLTVAYEDVGGNLSSFVQQPPVASASPAQIAYIVNTINQIPAADQQARACAVGKSLRYSAPSDRNAGYWFLTTDTGLNAYGGLGNAHNAFMQATCWINSLQPCPN